MQSELDTQTGLPSAGIYPRIETRPIAALAPNERNPRKVTADALGRLTKSLGEFGNLSPVTLNVRTGRVVGGHQRLKCLAAMGRTETEVWCVDLDERQESAAMLALNNTAGEWDQASLADMLKSLEADGVDIDLTGFTDATLDALDIDIGGEDGTVDAEPELDRSAELNKVWQVKPGDLWRIGEHRLLCGDSTNREDVERVMGGDAPSAIIMDPPFDVDYSSWLPVAESIRINMVWARGSTGLKYASDLAQSGWGVSTLVFSGQARGWALPEWPCLIHDVIYVLRRRVGGRERGVRLRGQPAAAYDLRVTEDGRPFSCYDGLSASRNDMGWAKNPACFAVFYCFCDEGEIIYDPCLGSGASMLGAEKSRVIMRAIELNPEWVALSLQRMKDSHPGIKIERLGKNNACASSTDRDGPHT